MTTTTARHKLPLLMPGQAQKEMFHNESLAAIDALLHAAVEGVGITTPPAVPGIGQSWIVGATPTGDWAGQAHALASWTDGGWRFQTPVPGLGVTLAATGTQARWDGEAWRVGDVRAERVLIGGVQVVGARRGAIPAPAGGATVDAEARAAVAAILSALRTHGLIA